MSNIISFVMLSVTLLILLVLVLTTKKNENT